MRLVRSIKGASLGYPMGTRLRQWLRRSCGGGTINAPAPMVLSSKPPTTEKKVDNLSQAEGISAVTKSEVEEIPEEQPGRTLVTPTPHVELEKHSKQPSNDATSHRDQDSGTGVKKTTPSETKASGAHSATGSVARQPEAKGGVHVGVKVGESPGAGSKETKPFKTDEDIIRYYDDAAYEDFDQPGTEWAALKGSLDDWGAKELKNTDDQRLKALALGPGESAGEQQRGISHDQKNKAVAGAPQEPAAEARGKRTDSQRNRVHLLREYLADKKATEDEAKRDGEAKRTPAAKMAADVYETVAPPIVYAFNFLVDFLDAVSSFASEVTFQTHFQVALNAIMLLRKAYRGARDLVNEIADQFEKIVKYLQEIDLLSMAVRGIDMYKAVNHLFRAIVTFIAWAGSYLSNWMIIKMALFIGGRNDHYKSYITAITSAYDEVQHVAAIGNILRGVQTLNTSMETLSVSQDIQASTLKMSQDLRELNGNLSKLQSGPDAFDRVTKQQLETIYSHTKFQAVLHVQSLVSKMFQSPCRPQQDLMFNDRERILLLPRDRQERHRAMYQLLDPRHHRQQGTDAAATSRHVPNGSPNNNSAAAAVAALSGRAARDRAAARPTRAQALVWIAGKTGRRGVSWVSSFSVDLAQHLEKFSNVDAAYVFCRRVEGARYTPAMMAKTLVAQLLELYPEAAVDNIRRLPPGVFEGVGDHRDAGAARRAWALLEAVLRVLRGTAEAKGRRILVLIDRLDLCESNFDFSVLRHFIPRLQALSENWPHVSVLITAAGISATEVHTLKMSPSHLMAYGKNVRRRQVRC